MYTQSGWLSQERRIAPISRVQTVDTERGPLEQLFGLANVTRPGPESWLHMMLRLTPFGSPSSVTVPVSVALPGGRDTVDGPLMVTFGGWFAWFATAGTT